MVKLLAQATAMPRNVAGGDARALGDGAELVGAGRLSQNGDRVCAVHGCLEIVRTVRVDREAVAAVILKHEGVGRSRPVTVTPIVALDAAVAQVTADCVTLAVAVPEPPVTEQLCAGLVGWVSTVTAKAPVERWSGKRMVPTQ